jgi:hypothetical protein
MNEILTGIRVLKVRLFAAANISRRYTDFCTFMTRSLFLLYLFHGAQVYAWEDSFMTKLFGVREQEMGVVIKSSYLKAVYNTILVRRRVSMLQSILLPNLSALIYFYYHFFFCFRWLVRL